MAALLAGCGHGTDSTPTASSAQSTSATASTTTSATSSVFSEFKLETKPVRREVSLPRVKFVDAARESGLVFTYQNGAKGKQLMIEATGGGCGWLDYDRDGLWDLYACQGGDASAPADARQPNDELFRNLDGSRFQSVAKFARVDDREYSQGVAVGDCDNDGFDDVLITNVACNRLLHNLGDGTFEDVTLSAKVADGRWSSTAAWGDIDLDGDLDLYVCNYADYDPKRPRLCLDKEGRSSMCHPQNVSPVPDEFFLNEGDGTFRECSKELGLFGEGNRALGVVIGRFDDDDWPDIFVANDTTANFLFISKAGRKFEDQAITLGCAVNSEGNPQANMGVACGDYDGNGYLDVYVTHFSDEWNTLWANYGPQGFADRTALTGMVSPTLHKLGWGTVMNDFNADSRMELLVANGHINDRRTEGDGYAMVAQLFSFADPQWVDIGAKSGDYFQHRLVGRGVATADYNGDGRLDVAIVHQNSPLALLRNESPVQSWISLEFIGRTSNRRGIGTRATARTASRSFMAELVGGTSYASSIQPLVHLGLGENVTECDLTVRWPNGVTQTLTAVPVNQSLRLVEPEAAPETAFDRSVSERSVDRRP